MNATRANSSSLSLSLDPVVFSLFTNLTRKCRICKSDSGEETKRHCRKLKRGFSRLNNKGFGS
jgi:hypothetical protein